MVTQTIKIDLTKDIITDHIIFKQGEIGREIEFEVYNEGVAVDLDGYDVTFSIYKPDGNFVIVSGTVDNDTVTIEETEQMTAVCGSGCFDLALTKTNEVIYTFKGFVDIATPIVTRATVNSVSMVFGLVFPDDFQEKLTAGENITIIDNVISASGGSGGRYSAGDYITILNNVIDVKSSLISTINGKANQSDLTALATVVNGKANQSDLTALATVVNGKANQSDLTALATVVNGKQDKINYSTNETNLGIKWIDNKDIYRIVITDTMPNAETEGTTVLKNVDAVSNVDTVVSIQAIILRNGSFVPLPYITDSFSSSKIQYDKTNSYLKLYNSVINFNGLDVTTVIYYTKNN